MRRFHVRLLHCISISKPYIPGKPSHVPGLNKPEKASVVDPGAQFTYLTLRAHPVIRQGLTEPETAGVVDSGAQFATHQRPLLVAQPAEIVISIILQHNIAQSSVIQKMGLFS